MAERDDHGAQGPAHCSDDFEERGVVTKLGELPTGSVITEDGLAGILGRHTCSIKRAIKRGEFPPPVRLLGKPVWTAGSILQHLEERLRHAAEDRDEGTRQAV